MTTLLNGLIGGLVVGILATVAVRAVESDRPAGTGASVAYGTVSGLVFVAVELYVAGILGVPPTLGEALGAAVGWSALLCVGWLAVGRLLRTDDGGTEGSDGGGAVMIPTDRVLIGYHLVFGVGLGLWVRLTWIT